MSRTSRSWPASCTSSTPGRPRSRPRSWCRSLPSDAADLELFLAERRGGSVHLRAPRRGEKRQLLELAERNAAETLAREQVRWLADQGKTLGALTELADALGLANPPLADRVLRHQQLPGQAVGRAAWSCSRTASRGPASTAASGSRRSRAPTTSPATRRSCGAASDGPRVAEEGSAEELRWRLPDLVIVDGGKGQVSAAAEVLDRARPRRPAPGRPGQGARGAVPARPDRADPAAADVAGALYLVQRLRDEAHRFAITYHRDLRAKASIRSAFDDLPGVGPKRKRALLRVFGSAKRIREAPVEQIAAVPGIGPALAGRIKTDPGGLGPALLLLSGAMRRAAPFLIVIIGIAALILDFWPNLTLPGLGTNPVPGRRDEAGARPAGRRPGRVPGPAQQRQVSPDAGDMSTIRDIIERRVNSTGRVRAARWSPRAPTGSSWRCPGATDADEITKLVGTTGRPRVHPAARRHVRHGQHDHDRRSQRA